MHSFQRPIRFPQHLFSVHDHGRQRSDRGPQHLPDLYIEPSPCGGVRPVTQSIATPGAVFEDDPHPSSDAGRPSARALSVSPRSGADGLVQGELSPISPEC